MDVLKLSQKAAQSFTRRLPSAAHLFDELVQEAAIAILAAQTKYRPGKLALESFVWPRAWKAMQTHCAAMGGPVNRVANEDGFHGTMTGVEATERMASETPETDHARAEADVTFKELCERAANAGNFKNPAQVADILHAALSGSTYDEVAKAHGLSRQRIDQLVAKSGIRALVMP